MWTWKYWEDVAETSERDDLGTRPFVHLDFISLNFINVKKNLKSLKKQ